MPKTLFLVIVYFLIFTLTSCSLYNDNYPTCEFIDSYITVKCDLKDYTILDETVDEINIGEKKYKINQYIIVDENNTVLGFEKSLLDFKKIKQKYSKVKDTISVRSLYSNKNNDSELIIDVNGNYHRAILSDQLKGEKVYEYQSIEQNFSINYENVTQLISEDKIYQITDQIISDDEIGDFVYILAKSIIFDADTKKEITNKELLQVDKNVDQKRTHWIYGDVRILKNGKNNYAVKINNDYHLLEVID